MHPANKLMRLSDSFYTHKKSMKGVFHGILVYLWILFSFSDEFVPVL